jgi:hypothetical protein
LKALEVYEIEHKLFSTINFLGHFHFRSDESPKGAAFYP